MTSAAMRGFIMQRPMALWIVPHIQSVSIYEGRELRFQFHRARSIPKKIRSTGSSGEPVAFDTHVSQSTTTRAHDWKFNQHDNASPSNEFSTTSFRPSGRHFSLRLGTLPQGTSGVLRATAQSHSARKTGLLASFFADSGKTIVVSLHPPDW